ncbi:TniQ family protein [Pseudomonas grandcourensis]
MSCIPEPVVGESLSSWIFRVQLIKREYLDLSSFDKSNPFTELGSKSAENVDPDVNSLDALINDFSSTYDVPKSYLLDKFQRSTQPIMAKHYSSAYCYECIASSIRTIGAPHMKVAWCFALAPVCTVHGKVLNDRPSYSSSVESSPRQVFLWHTENLFSSKLKWRERASYDVVSALALRVQNLHESIRASAINTKRQCMIDNFILTIVRALLMPSVSCFYSNRFQSETRLGNNNSFSDSWFRSFFHNVFLASASERAIAMCLTGVLLGWITNEEAELLQPVYDREQNITQNIWTVFKSDANMLHWLKFELLRNETDLLSLAQLSNKPGSWK